MKPNLEPEVPQSGLAATQDGTAIAWLAMLAGFSVANLYNGQALLGPIAHHLSLTPAWSGGLVAITQLGYALGLAQLGARHPNAKPWKGEGPGILEIVEDHRGDTYRAVYAVRFADVVYVLHAFQKKSKRGIKTPQTDVKLIAERLKSAQADYESRGMP